MKNKVRWSTAVALVLAIVLVAGSVYAQSPWTRIQKLLVENEAYVLGSLQVDGTVTFSGATASGAIDLNGNDLTIDADGDSILDEVSDDNIRMTLGGATGLFNVLTGNLKVGDGSPTQALNAEDAYVEGTFENDGGAYLDGATYFGGGYGTTGCTISAAGAISCDDAAIFGGGHGSTGLTIAATGNLDTNGDTTMDGTLIVTGTLTAKGKVTADSVEVGGAYTGSSGCTMSTAGVLQCNGAMTTDSSVTAASAAVGGGHGSTGLTMDSSGDLDMNGNQTVDGTIIVTGTLTAKGSTALNGGLTMDTSAFTVADTTGNVATAGTIAQTLVNPAGGSANPYDWTGALGIMDGTDDFTLFDVNMTNADHTGSPNTVQVLDVSNITGDADATETAINIGTGWDAGIAVDSPLTVGGGYGSTGCTLSTAGAISCNDAAIVGGGHGSTGTTLAATGDIDTNGNVTVDGTLIVTGTITAKSKATIDNVDIGGGYGSTGCSVSNAGAMSCNDAVIAGGGHGSTGVTLAATGDIDTNGNVTIDGTFIVTGTVTEKGTVAMDNITVGGGYGGGSGCTVSTAGVLQCNGAATFDGSLTVGGSPFNYMGTLKVTENTLLTTAQNGWMIVLGAGKSVTVTLESATVGESHCFYNFDAATYNLKPQAGDQIHSLTDNPGDLLTDTDGGDSICLVAIDTTYWVPFSREGTWTMPD